MAPLSRATTHSSSCPRASRSQKCKAWVHVVWTWSDIIQLERDLTNQMNSCLGQLVRAVKKHPCRTPSVSHSADLLPPFPHAERRRFHILTAHRCTRRGCPNSPSLSDPCWRVRRKFCKPVTFWFSLLIFTAEAGPPYRSTNPKSCQTKARKIETTNSRKQRK